MTRVAVPGPRAHPSGLCQIGVGAHDGGGIAAQLEHDPFPGPRGRDPVAGGRTSSERNRPDFGGRHERRAERRAPVEELHRFRRQARVKQDADEERRSAGCLRRRLHDGRIARCERRGHLVREQVDRRVERRDREDDADR